MNCQNNITSFWGTFLRLCSILDFVSLMKARISESGLISRALPFKKDNKSMRLRERERDLDFQPRMTLCSILLSLCFCLLIFLPLKPDTGEKGVSNRLFHLFCFTKLFYNGTDSTLSLYNTWVLT